MNISRENYEVYFIDYLDGNLNPQEIAGLMLFLSANPDLEEELAEMKEQDLSLTIEQSEISFKNSLKRSKKDLMITGDNFNELCVAKMEGDLKDTDAEMFDRYLELNNEKLNDYRLFEQTRLEPDMSVEFEAKASLKRRYVGKRPNRSWIYSVSGAAAIVLIFLMFFNNSYDSAQTFLRGEDYTANIKHKKSVSKGSFEPFSVIGTETPSILARSVHTPEMEENNTAEYQYVDPAKAGFLKDMVSKLRSMNTGDDDQYVASNFFKLQNNTQNNNENSEEVVIQPNKEELFTVSPKSIVLVSGELNSNDFLSNVLDEMGERYDEGNESPDDKITFWDIAETGVKGYSQLTGKKIVFSKETNDKGKITSLAINSGKFEFTRKKK